MYHSKILRNLFVAFAASLIAVFSTVVSAKSVYLISDINASPTPIQAYDVQPDGTLVFQFEGTVPRRGGGGVGIAADAVSETLFVTYEVSNIIQVVDGTSLADLGTTTAPSATNLAGAVYDQTNQLLYAVDRGTSNLYVYSWDAVAQTLTLLSGGGTGPETLAGLSGGAYGIALDEATARLYVADTDATVNYYNTTDWTLGGTLNIGGTGTPRVISVAVDSINGQLYTAGNFFGDDQLRKHDIATDTTTAQVTSNVIGLAVDSTQGNVYATTGYSPDSLLAFDANLNPLQAAIALPGDPTGLVVPEISYNPLAFSKVGSPDPVPTGSNLTYTLCYDNLTNTIDVTNVVITDEIPVGTTFVSATNSPGMTSTMVTWTVGTVLAGAAQVCENMVVNVTAAEGDTILNSATIDSNETPPTTQTESTVVSVVVEDVSFTGKGAGSTGPLGLLVGLLLLALRSLRRINHISSAFALTISSLLLSMAITTTASANNPVYYGLSVGSASTDIKNSDYDADLLGLGYTASSSIDNDTFGWKAFGGYSINKVWDIEVAYVNLGDVTSKTDVSNPALSTAVEQQPFVDSAVTVHPYSVDGLSLVGKANWHVNNNFSLFGKLGAFTWNADIDVDCVGCSASVSASGSESGTDWTAGVGALYKFSNRVGVRAEYERFATDRDDIDFISLGIQVNF